MCGSLIVGQNTSEQNMLNGSEIWFGIEKNEGNICLLYTSDAADD